MFNVIIIESVLLLKQTYRYRRHGVLDHFEKRCVSTETAQGELFPRFMSSRCLPGLLGYPVVVLKLRLESFKLVHWL